MRATFIGLLVMLAAAAAGCGGEDRLSRDELIAEADAICAEYESRLDELEEPESIDDVERFAEEARPIVEEGNRELSELEPPEDLEDQYDEWIAQNEEAEGVIEDLEEAAAEGDEGRIQEILAEAEQSEQEADELAGELGLQDCGSD